MALICRDRSVLWSFRSLSGSIQFWREISFSMRVLTGRTTADRPADPITHRSRAWDKLHFKMADGREEDDELDELLDSKRVTFDYLVKMCRECSHDFSTKRERY